MICNFLIQIYDASTVSPMDSDSGNMMSSLSNSFFNPLNSKFNIIQPKKNQVNTISFLLCPFAKGHKTPRRKGGLKSKINLLIYQVVEPSQHDSPGFNSHFLWLKWERPLAISSALTNSLTFNNSGNNVKEAVVLPAPLQPAMIKSDCTFIKIREHNN